MIKELQKLTGILCEMPENMKTLVDKEFLEKLFQEQDVTVEKDNGEEYCEESTTLEHAALKKKIFKIKRYTYLHPAAPSYWKEIFIFITNQKGEIIFARYKLIRNKCGGIPYEDIGWWIKGRRLIKTKNYME